MRSFEQYQVKARRKAIQDRFSKSLLGRISSSYHNILGRIRGKRDGCQHLYVGLPVVPREEFTSWALADKDLLSLYTAWVESNYSRRLVPSIDRLDTKLGYTLDNMRWVSHWKNSSLGGISQGRQRKPSNRARAGVDDKSYRLGYRAGYTAGRKAV